jgi:serine/threonine-protein kinase
VNLISHRNIVDIPDIVELEDGTTFIVMELLSGISLGKWARTGVDLPRALAVLVQICDGLAAAHAVGVIHRDLKPDNVIVVPTSDGAELVKLLDFGVAKLLNRDDEDIGFQTAAGSVIGTPAYMSPEQAGGMAIDHRSDIYSLGAIMYELFCGQAMFRGRSFGEYVRKHLTEMPVRPRATAGGKDLDERIEALILKCLEKEPSQRFAHIAELRDGLFALLGGEPPPTFPGSGSYRPATPSPVRAPTIPSLVSAANVSQLHASQISQLSHPSQVQMFAPSQTYVAPARSPWWMWAAGGLVAIGLGIGAAVWVAGGHGAAPVAPATPPVTQPVVADTPITPKTASVRFDSLPAASVYADGHAAELCKTPCSYDVDLRDGGPTDRRTFVVRQAGYLDAQIAVDLTAAHPALSVTLERVPAVVAPPPADPTPPVEPKHVHPTHTAKPVEAKPAVPVEAKPVKQPGGDTIDQTETLDPFHSK